MVRFYFPGQGAQYAGMGEDLYEHSPWYRQLVEDITKNTGIDLRRVMMDEDKIHDTTYAQLAIFTMSYGLAKLLQEGGLTPKETLGISLGEYGALTFSGALDLGDTLHLLKERSRLMKEAAMAEEGFMAAVSFLGLEEVEKVLATEPLVSISNYNGHNQLVIGGPMSRKEALMDKMKAQGAKKVTPLQVSGAFHTSMMQKAAEGFFAVMEKVEPKALQIPVYSNVTGKLHGTKEALKKLLVDHIDHPVKLYQSLAAMEKSPSDVHVVLGPGKAMGSLLKQNKVPGEVVYVSSFEELTQALAKVKE